MRHILIETWLEDGEKCVRITAPPGMKIIEKDLDKIKKENNGINGALLLAEVWDLKHDILKG